MQRTPLLDFGKKKCNILFALGFCTIRWCSQKKAKKEALNEMRGGAIILIIFFQMKVVCAAAPTPLVVLTPT